MSVRFIHTADWQLGRAFGRFPKGLASRLEAARLDAIDTIAQHARNAGAADVLVAGDVWDQETPSPPTLLQPLDRLRRAADVVWWLLPGNHDPARPRGLWDRLADMELPANVRLCTTPEPRALSDDAWLLPAPLTSKRPLTDPTQGLGAQATPPGVARIGLAHGPVQSFSEDALDTATIAVDRAHAADLAYLALGDWHGRLRIGARTWYAGTPEPDRFPRNEPGWCLEVAIDGARAEPTVTPLATAQFRWRHERIDWLPGLGMDRLDTLAGDAAVPADRTLVALELVGTARLGERARLNAHLASLGARLAHLEIEADGLETVVEAEDLDAFGAEPVLREAASRLAEQARTDSAARRALDLLATWAVQP